MRNELPKGVYYIYAFGDKILDETIDKMIPVMEQERKNPFLVKSARSIVRKVKSHDTTGEIEEIFNFVRDYVRYVKDPVDIEWIAYPSLTLNDIIDGLKQQKENGGDYVPLAHGDCDCHSILIATLLLSIGIPCKFKVIAQKKNMDYHHIYVVAYNDKKDKWVALDAIHKGTGGTKLFKVGDEVPHEKSKLIDFGLVESYE